MVLKCSVFTCLAFSVLSACNSGSAGSASGISASYSRLLRALYRNTVPTVQPVALARELGRPAGPLLLDVRTPAEYQVSHLQGARFVNYATLANEQFAGLNRQQSVVVYCSVGCRSERLGEHLHTLGFAHVRNLYGGLFEWVNEGFPVYNAAGVTSNVHPYSAVWSSWLKRGKKVYE